MDQDRLDRMRARLTKFGEGLLSKEAIERICRGKVEEPKTTEDKYLSMFYYPVKPRQRDADGIRMSKRQVKKALVEIREELGYPDFRHKMWRNVK